MKILYIAMKYDYGNPARGMSFEHYNFYDSLMKMEGGRHEVVYFPFDEMMRNVGRKEMNSRLLETAEREHPDVCFFFLFTDEIEKDTIRAVRKRSGAITFNWFADDHWRFDNFSKYYAPCFDWVSTTDSLAPEKYRKIGYTNVIKTQWACNHFLYKPAEQLPVPNPQFKYDVTFVGQPHGNRRATIKALAHAGINVECWGTGWPNGHANEEEMIRIFSQSKINLNLTKSADAWGIKPLAKIFLYRNAQSHYGIYSPFKWADNWKSFLGIRHEQIKGRNFQVPGCGGFLLTADADNLRDYYEDGKEIVIFKDGRSLIERIQYYLSHENERGTIARHGYERTLWEHTYEKRFQKIFDTILYG